MPFRRDSVDTLPQEAFIEAVKWATIEEGLISQELLLSLTLVSARWRNTILLVPRLWSHIDLVYYNATPDGDAKISLALALAKRVPLTISVGFPSLTAKAQALIRDISSQISTIRIQREGIQLTEWSSCANRTLQALQRTATYPSLTQIDFETYVTVDHRVIGDITSGSHNFKSLKWVRFTSDTVAFANVPEIDEVEIAVCAKGSAKISRAALSTFRSVVIRPASIDDLRRHEDPSASLVGFGNLLDVPKDVTYPLKALKCDYYSFEINWITRFSNMISLDIMLSAIDMHHLARLLFELPFLFHLGLTLNSSPGTYYTSSSDPSMMHKNNSIGEVHFKNTHQDEHHKVSEQQAAMLLGTVAPNIKCLVLDAYYESSVFEWAGGAYFPCLQDLSYNYSKKSLLHERRPLSSSIRFLSALDLQANQSFPLGENVEVLRTRYVSLRAQVTGQYDINFIRLLQLKHLSDLNFCARLHTLDVVLSSGVSWEKVDLPRLEILQIVDMYIEDIACLTFSRYLASNPTTLPRLKNLTLKGALEMDILFIMLEQRNINATRVSRISSLSLFRPSARHFSALRHLWQSRPWTSTYQHAPKSRDFACQHLELISLTSQCGG